MPIKDRARGGRPVLSKDARDAFALCMAIIDRHTKSTCSGIGDETVVARLTAESIRSHLTDIIEECEAVGQVVDPVTGEPPVIGARPTLGDDHLSKLSHHVALAAAHGSQIEVVRRWTAMDYRKGYVSYPKPTDPPGPFCGFVDDRVYHALVEEAEELCAHTRSATDCRPDWLPDNVQEISIRWWPESYGKIKDRFGIILKFVGTL